MNRFEGRTILVTGAGSGIGRASALRLAQEGGRIIAVDRDQARLDESASMLAGEGHACRALDTTDESALTRMAAEIARCQGPTRRRGPLRGHPWLRPLQLSG